MSETISRRQPQAHVAPLPGRPIEVLPSDLRVALDARRSHWCGDFCTDKLGFGHLRVRALAPPPGTLGLRQGSLQLVFVCDGFFRGALAQPEVHGWILLGPLGLGEMAPDQVGPSTLRLAPLELLHRPSYTWRTIDRSGQSPELQLAAARVRLEDLSWRGDQGIEAFAALETSRGLCYLNLDGVPRRNFVIAANLLRPEPSDL